MNLTTTAEPPSDRVRQLVRGFQSHQSVAELTGDWWNHDDVITAHQILSRQFIAEDRAPTPSGQGRGIVVCTGGHKLFTNAWVCLRMLRLLGCQLPIQFWYLDEHEIDAHMQALVRPHGVECVNAAQLDPLFPVRRLGGWELKAYALLHNPFAEVLLLDADNVPLRDPTFLFETAPYLETGATFWPDFWRMGPERIMWRACEVAYRDEPEHETGQILVDKRRCHAALRLALHYNEHSDFYYHHNLGDKDTFHMAFHRLGLPFSMPSRRVDALHPSTMLQYDFEGQPLFQHRNHDKWKYDGSNERVPGFVHEDSCLEFLDELRSKWNGRVHWQDQPTAMEQKLIEALSQQIFRYQRVGYDQRDMTLRPDRTIGQGAGGLEQQWTIQLTCGEPLLTLHGGELVICALRPRGNRWQGRWFHFERMPIRLARYHEHGWAAAFPFTLNRLPVPATVEQQMTFRNGWEEGIYRSIVEQNEYRLPQSVAGWTIIDGGAHVGSFSRVVSELGAARVIAIEANPGNYRICQQNLRGTNVKLYHRALWSENDITIDMIADRRRDNTGGFRATLADGKSQSASSSPDLVVPAAAVTITLETIIETEQLAEIDFLKLDIEGAEARVFAALAGDLLARIKRIALECHGQQAIDIVRARLTPDYHLEQGAVCDDPEHGPMRCIYAVRRELLAHL